MLQSLGLGCAVHLGKSGCSRLSPASGAGRSGKETGLFCFAHKQLIKVAWVMVGATA